MKQSITPIPPTSKSCYLGGVAALNLPSPAGTGDWHIMGFFMPGKRPLSFLCGTGCPTNTLPLLGEIGIYDCTSILDNLGIPHESSIAYAANHARATADLVLAAVMRGGNPDFVVLDNWMPRDSDKQQVFDLLYKAFESTHLTTEQQNMVLTWKHNSI